MLNTTKADITFLNLHEVLSPKKTCTFYSDGKQGVTKFRRQLFLS